MGSQRQNNEIIIVDYDRYYNRGTSAKMEDKCLTLSGLGCPGKVLKESRSRPSKVLCTESAKYRYFLTCTFVHKEGIPVMIHREFQTVCTWGLCKFFSYNNGLINLQKELIY